MRAAGHPSCTWAHRQRLMEITKRPTWRRCLLLPLTLSKLNIDRPTCQRIGGSICVWGSLSTYCPVYLQSIFVYRFRPLSVVHRLVNIHTMAMFFHVPNTLQFWISIDSPQTEEQRDWPLSVVSLVYMTSYALPEQCTNPSASHV